MALREQQQSPLLDHCPQSLPAHVYYDPDWYQREVKKIWARNWIYVGRLNDLAPGSLRRITVAGDSLLLCRTAEGQVAAYHNTCRHRGAELCSEETRALGKLISCPYHAWSYAADNGRLVSVGAAVPTDDFKRAEHGLFPVLVSEWNGFLYVCLSDEPPEFRTDTKLSVLDNWPMGSLITGYRSERDLACNWKVFWENYNECLHCPGVHPELCDLVPIYSKGIMSRPEASHERQLENLPTTPLKEGAKSWTADGRPCGPEFERLTDEERARAYTFVTLLPTQYIVAHVDYVRSVSITPTGPETMRLTAEWLFSPETLAEPGFKAETVAAFAQLVMDQDGAVAEINQRGLRSSKFETGRLMPQEFDIRSLHQWILGQMEAA
ncbi:MAG: aromatic ring-hydroxylating dioxygenase subunit alpha [Paracoccaceae bacterium]